MNIGRHVCFGLLASLGCVVVAGAPALAQQPKPNKY
jgi:hypothetical protein